MVVCCSVSLVAVPLAVLGKRLHTELWFFVRVGEWDFRGASSGVAFKELCQAVGAWCP